MTMLNLVGEKQENNLVKVFSTRAAYLGQPEKEVGRMTKLGGDIPALLDTKNVFT